MEIFEIKTKVMTSEMNLGIATNGQDLKAGMKDLKCELKSEIENNVSELKTEIENNLNELKTDMKAIKASYNKLMGYVRNV